MLGSCNGEELVPGTLPEDKSKQHSQPRRLRSEAPSVSQPQTKVIHAWRTFYPPTSKRRAEAIVSENERAPRGADASSASRSTDTRSRGANTAQTICQPVAHRPHFPRSHAFLALESGVAPRLLDCAPLKLPVAGCLHCVPAPTAIHDTAAPAECSRPARKCLGGAAAVTPLSCAGKKARMSPVRRSHAFRGLVLSCLA